jgi:drug/metabolite transporter (DMT)-like permease
MMLAAPVLWLLAAVFKNSPSSNDAVGPHVLARSPFAPVFWSGMFFACDLAVWHFSIMYTTVANATLLANFAPVVVTLISWLWWRQQPSGGFVLGMTLALSGAVVLIGPGFSSQRSQMVGDTLGLATALFYAGYMLAIKRAREHRNTLQLMAWSTTISAVLLLPVALVFQSRTGVAFLPKTSEGWWLLFGLAVVTQVAGQTFIAYASAHLSVALSSTSLLVQPLVATVLAWGLFNERLDLFQIVGGVSLVAGIYWARRSG